MTIRDFSIIIYLSPELFPAHFIIFSAWCKNFCQRLLNLVDMTKKMIVRKRNIEKFLKFWKRYIIDRFFGVFQRGNGKFCLVKNAPSGEMVSKRPVVPGF